MTRARPLDLIHLRKLVYYDESSPTCLRFTNNNTVAGRKDSSGYFRFCILNRKYLVHRVIFALYSNMDIENLEVDHLNTNKLDNRIENLRAVTPSINSRNKRKQSVRLQHSTGVVFHTSATGYSRARAQWRDMDGNLQSKSFNINKLGIMVAFRDAVIYRQKMIEELNARGAGYTERHGKDINESK